MKIGLVGFAGSGKTTVFNTLTGLSVPTGFGGTVHLGTVKVPDERIDRLSAMFKPKKTTYAEIVFSDIPGEHGAEHKGLSRKALEPIRAQDVLCLVLRAFPNPAVETKADPAAELEAFHVECILADLEMVERKLDRAKKDKTDPLHVSAFELMKQTLEAERPIRSLSEPVLHREMLTGFSFLTDKPLLAVLNRSEDEAALPMPEPLTKRLAQLSAAGLVLSASVEAEIAQLDPADQAAFLADLGLKESARARFVRTAYELLDLISFFTVGEDEVRAWPIRRGTHARAAAGKIHSDLERGFIRAEVMAYGDFIAHGSEHAVKEAGKFKLEGKDYVVADGDIMSIRFNV
ncbi:MAG: YchF family ATPase [Gemmatimonadota bacterium]|nr:YchF family ATPase [Gemmatimonadota bacterium]MDH5283459.1 YchF family ATPase [Gemmatimonadota bacterium]